MKKYIKSDFSLFSEPFARIVARQVQKTGRWMLDDIYSSGWGADYTLYTIVVSNGWYGLTARLKDIRIENNGYCETADGGYWVIDDYNPERIDEETAAQELDRLLKVVYDGLLGF